MHTKVGHPICFVRQPPVSGLYVSNSRLIAHNTTDLNECDNGCEVYDYDNKVWVVDAVKNVNILIDECGSDSSDSEPAQPRNLVYQQSQIMLESGVGILRPKFTTVFVLFVVMVLIEVYLG